MNVKLSLVVFYNREEYATLPMKQLNLILLNSLEKKRMSQSLTLWISPRPTIVEISAPLVVAATFNVITICVLG